MIIKFFKNIGGKFMQNKFLFFVFCFYLIFCFNRIYFYPVYIDEAHTYNDCVSKDFWSILSFYKEPNNHVLFSLLCKIFSFLPIDNLLALRLPNLILGLLCTLIFYKYLKFKFNIFSANFGLVFFSFSYFFVFYSVFARGYMLIILITILIYYIIDFYSGKESLKLYLYFSILIFLGFATIPIFLYVSLSFLIILIIRYNKKLKILFNFLLSYFLAAILTFVFYLPIIIKEGIKAIVNNKWTKQLSYKDVYEYITVYWKHFYDKIFGVSSFYIVLILLIISLYYCFKYKILRSIIIECLIVIILPFLFIIVHKVIPGTRTWSYLVVPFTILLTLFVSKLSFNFFLLKFQYLFLIFVIGIQLYIFTKSHPKFALENDYISQLIVAKINCYNFENINFINGEQSYEAVIYKFEQKRKFSSKNKKIQYDANCVKGALNVGVMDKNKKFKIVLKESYPLDMFVCY